MPTLEPTITKQQNKHSKYNTQTQITKLTTLKQNKQHYYLYVQTTKSSTKQNTKTNNPKQ